MQKNLLTALLVSVGIGSVHAASTQPAADTMTIIRTGSDGEAAPLSLNPAQTFSPVLHSFSYEWQSPSPTDGGLMAAASEAAGPVTRARYLAPLYYEVGDYFAALIPQSDGSWKDVSGISMATDAEGRSSVVWPYGESNMVSRSVDENGMYTADPADEGALLVAFTKTIVSDSLVDNVIPLKRTTAKGARLVSSNAGFGLEAMKWWCVDSRLATDASQFYAYPSYAVSGVPFAFEQGQNQVVSVPGSGEALKALTKQKSSAYRTIVLPVDGGGSKEFRVPTSALYQAVGVSPSGVMRGPARDGYEKFQSPEGAEHIAWQNTNGSLVWMSLLGKASATPSSVGTTSWYPRTFAASLAPYYLKVGGYFYALMLPPQAANTPENSVPDYPLIGADQGLQGFTRAAAGGVAYGIYVDSSDSIFIKTGKNVLPQASDAAFLAGDFDNVLARDVLCARADFLEKGESRYVLRSLDESAAGSSFSTYQADSYFVHDSFDGKYASMIFKRVLLDPSLRQWVLADAANRGGMPYGWCGNQAGAVALSCTLIDGRTVPCALAVGPELFTTSCFMRQSSRWQGWYQFFYYDEARNMVYALDSAGLKGATLSVHASEDMSPELQKAHAQLMRHVAPYLESLGRKMSSGPRAGEQAGSAVGKGFGSVFTGIQDLFTGKLF